MLRKYLLLICLVFASFIQSKAEIQSVGNVVSFEKKANVVTLQTSSGASVQVSFFDLETVRVRMSKSATFEREFSYAFDYSVERKTPTVKVLQTNAEIIISNYKNAKVVVNKNPLMIQIFDENNYRVNSDSSPMAFDRDSGEVRAVKSRHNLETFYGFGEKALPFSRDGQYITNWNTDAYGYVLGTDPLYQSIPFFYSLFEGKSYGIFLHNTYRTFFDMGKSSPDRYSFGSNGGELDYFVFLGSPKNILENYANLTGKMPLPPLWSIGNQQCRFSYFPESRVREIAEGFRSRKIPADAIYIDIDYMDGFRVFIWDKAKFPNPKKLNEDLAKMGFKSILILNPAVKVDEKFDIYRTAKENGYFVKRRDGSTFEGNVWAGKSSFLDFTNPKVRDWFGGLYRQNLDDGISGFWNDMNEPSVFPVWETNIPALANSAAKTLPVEVEHNGDNFGLEKPLVRKIYGNPRNDKQRSPNRPKPVEANHARFHNVYGMQMARATFEGLRKLEPDKRPFVLSRAGFSGIQRFAAVWTGDNSATWDHLRLSIPMLLNMSVSGIPFIGSDIGGYSGNPTPELYTRWIQSHVFMPLFRPHSEKDAANKEPWEFGEPFTSINRTAIEMRYQFLPYLYTLFHEQEKTGSPIVRPLWFEYPNDRRTYLTDDEYLVGKDILVAPVMREGERKRNVYFPVGDDWRDWQTGDIYKGGNTFLIDAPLEKLLVFGRVGSVIPTQPVVQHTGEMQDVEITLNVIVGIAAGKVEVAKIWQDRGEGYGYKLNDWREISTTHKAGSLSINRIGDYKGQKIKFIEAIGVGGKPSEMRIDGKLVENINFDEKLKRIRIEINEYDKEITLRR